ncbi:phage neck terminator protein [Bordetella genomosp. 1]|uniref:Phage neck terminator protein gp12-like domain-containing protein n=1 Tax=Bordetella genomosp. 1 TaxID=1395607 RepID=A0ABX4EVQ3_9BORD|nr:hypothetical protein [Bordetella genomosp. 1]MDQ8033237.1 hypothetical protein [Bordetella sp.]OZI57876.1 hypothetical protein CAL27_20980 [Bordetella genomosp. 1]
MNDSASGGYLIPAQTTPAEEDRSLDLLLAGVVAGISGLDPQWVQPLWQSAPAADPGQTWCEVGVTAQDADVNPAITHDSTGEGSDRYRRDQHCTVSCLFHGPAAKQYAQVLADGVWVPQNREVMGRLGLACRSASAIRAEPLQTEQTWERRYALTLVLLRSITRTYLVRNLVSAVSTTHTDIVGATSN